MAAPSRIEGDVFINGNLRPKSFSPPAESITNAAIKAAAGIEAEKTEHLHRQIYAQESDTTAAAESRVVHVVYGATGDVVAFEAGIVVACIGDATITIDLKKNGVSVLTGAIVLDSTNAVRIVEAATIDTAGLVDGDVLEVVVTVNAGTGTLGKGVFAALTVHENAE